METMKKDRTKTHGYSLTEIVIVTILLLAAILIAGTCDYNDLKESETYWKTQTK